jgi:predicted RND superfamily exporter protein
VAAAAVAAVVASAAVAAVSMAVAVPDATIVIQRYNSARRHISSHETVILTLLACMVYYDDAVLQL